MAANVTDNVDTTSNDNGGHIIIIMIISIVLLLIASGAVIFSFIKCARRNAKKTRVSKKSQNFYCKPWPLYMEESDIGGNNSRPIYSEILDISDEHFLEYRNSPTACPCSYTDVKTSNIPGDNGYLKPIYEGHVLSKPDINITCNTTVNQNETNVSQKTTCKCSQEKVNRSDIPGDNGYLKPVYECNNTNLPGVNITCSTTVNQNETYVSENKACSRSHSDLKDCGIPGDNGYLKPIYERRVTNKSGINVTCNTTVNKNQTYFTLPFRHLKTYNPLHPVDDKCVYNARKSSSRNLKENDTRKRVKYDSVPGCENTEEKFRLYVTDLTNKPWTMKAQVTKEGCQLHQENSDIKWSIPQKAVDVPTRVSGSVLYNVPELRKIFEMNKTEILVAPVVEHQLKQMEPLHTYACIQIPHCMGQNVEQMQVWSFSYDRAENKIKRQLVSAKGRVSSVESSEDMYWKIVDFRTIKIFTKHLSGFLCTACEKYVEFDIRAYLFHFFGEKDGETSVSFNLKLAGPLSRISDFEKIILSEMKGRHYSLVNKRFLILGRRKEGCLRFNLKMAHKSTCDWHPIKRTSGRSMSGDQEVTLDQLITCENTIATENSWYLQSNSKAVKRCSVRVDVKHIIDAEPVQTTTICGVGSNPFFTEIQKDTSL